VTELKAQIMIFVIAAAVMVVAVLGLAALEANSSAIALGVIIPAGVASYLISRVVMHYGRVRDSEKPSRR
jgi:hypothetical protein